MSAAQHSDDAVRADLAAALALPKVEKNTPISASDICGRLNRAVRQAGSLKKWCELHQVPYQHAKDFIGSRCAPGKQLLQALKLRSRLVYEEIAS